ncbi:MAG TPA: family 78 glycoside hydrolase catalytic domain [Chitinophagaceae bacterium]|nr:family 78 glycoside hydrolase catalytic domain [Chitinophagaceae bacterium]
MRKSVAAFIFFLFQLSLNSPAQLRVNGLLCENRKDPVGLDAWQPRLTWKLSTANRDVLQTAYEIRVGTRYKGNEVKGLSWSSGKIFSDSSVQVCYKGIPLESGIRYYWQVRVWDNQGNQSSWSKPDFWQMGLLHLSDWTAKWIEPGFVESYPRPCPLLRREFTLDRKIRSATLYITAHGLYEAKINGRRVGDAYLTPGWTSYHHRLQYQVYDVGAMLHPGSNAIGVTLGNGWYRGTIGFSGHKNVYGKHAALLLQLNIMYTDGSSEQVVSDSHWKSSTGKIRSAAIYNGETIDARMDPAGWTHTGYNDASWSQVKQVDFPMDNLIATRSEPVTKHETFSPLRIFMTPKGEQVLDFGQNLVGWVVMKVRGKAGDTVTIGHAEVLDKAGNFYTANLRSAKALDTYILNGKGEEIFEPHFTFHGFRYVRVTGYPGKILPEDFKAVALYTDMPSTGQFTTSNPLVNQLQHNIRWSQRGNFLDIPTDCPQRDERLGWTGDAQVFSRTASFNRNVNAFFAKWMQDVAADQAPSGAVPFVIPNILGSPSCSAGWADVATIVPWNMYLAYGDTRMLGQQYPSMKAWVEYIRHQAHHDLWNTGFDFGDWLFYRPADDNDGRSAVTDKYLIAQCFYAHSTQLLINAARVLGKQPDVDFYTALLQRIKSAFAREYMTPDGRLVSGTQTAYVLALEFGMLPDSMRNQAARRLVDNIKSYNDHLTTGFLGTPYLCHVLTRFGYNGIACSLLLQQTYPSWLYEVKMGATTIWERWDGIKPDSTFETPSMNSFNHYAYGAIGDWMYRKLAGLDTYPDGPGYHHIRIMPHPDHAFHRVSASLETYYGRAGSAWTLDSGILRMDDTIPPNTTADIFVPAASAASITESGTQVADAKDIQVIGMKQGYVELKTGSGQYHFSTPMR